MPCSRVSLWSALSDFFVDVMGVIDRVKYMTRCFHQRNMHTVPGMPLWEIGSARVGVVLVSMYDKEGNDFQCYTCTVVELVFVNVLAK